MRKLRTETPQPKEYWEEADIMAHLGYDKQTAKKLMDECRSRYPKDCKGYDAIEKHIILDFINEKQREEREREARYNADIATAESFAVLKEQVKTLKEQVAVLRESSEASSEDARKVRTQSLLANFISFISIAIAIIALVLN